MRVLLTGANGYIGSRLLPVLTQEGHHIYALVRSAQRLALPPSFHNRVTVVVADLLNKDSLKAIPGDVDVAYYLVHSMEKQAKGFSSDEARSAENFHQALNSTACKQIIYLSGLASDHQLSEHMASRRNVEEILHRGPIPLTVLRAGIIIGSGSASFEIIRDLVEKLPVMVAPRWVGSLCQPIAIHDVIFYLKEVLGKNEYWGKTFDIGGPEQLTYRDMLLTFAQVRGLRRLIIPVPVLTPRLSSYWLFFITSTSFPLAQALVDSLRMDAVCVDRSIVKVIPHDCLTYEESLKRAFVKIEQNAVISSWKDAIVISRLDSDLTRYIKVPTHGCLKKEIQRPYRNRETAIKTLWRVGDHTGWYYMNWAWRIRGFIDKLIGGVGLRRGRTHPEHLHSGDALDFWRVLLADQKQGHLLLYAEMRLPGEAWLEYHIEGKPHEGTVTQIATFRPKGLLGRLYWYLLIPIHYLIFHGLCKAIAQGINPKTAEKT
ncbi:MAG: SDR family oxidoreductase [Waddliaceae bacterium]